MRISDWSSDVCSSDLSRPLMDGSTIFQRHLLVRVVDHLALVFERDVGQFVKPVEGQSERVWDAIHTGVGDKIIVGRKIAAAHGEYEQAPFDGCWIEAAHAVQTGRLCERTHKLKITVATDPER